jgi:hypothetical protein
MARATRALECEVSYQISSALFSVRLLAGRGVSCQVAREMVGGCLIEVARVIWWFTGLVGAGCLTGDARGALVVYGTCLIVCSGGGACGSWLLGGLLCVEGSGFGAD